VQSKADRQDVIAVVAGSGINLDTVLDATEEVVSFDQIDGLPTGAVAGHASRFLIGATAGRPVIVQCGRLHLYEGFDYSTVVRTVDYLHDRGVRAILFTNAAGGLLPGMSPGDLVAVERIRMWRYRRWDATPGILLTDFQVMGCPFAGTYQWVPGPAYETRAEIAAMQHSGAVAVGMSTAPEVMRCQELGIQTAVVACITNSCCKVEPLSHDRVLAAGRAASANLTRLLRAEIANL